MRGRRGAGQSGRGTGRGRQPAAAEEGLPSPAAAPPQCREVHPPAGTCICSTGSRGTVHVLMRDEKEERSKQGQTNNKAKQHSTHMYMYIRVGTCICRRKEEASKVKQTTKQSNTTHPGNPFSKKNRLPRVGFKPICICTCMYVHVHLQHGQ